MLAPRGLGLQDPTKKLARQVKLLGQSLSQKNAFQNFGPEPPLNIKLTTLLTLMIISDT